MAIDTDAAATVPFGVLLKRLRLRARLTQEQLASRSGLSVEAVGALERGSRRHPRPATLSLLAGALKLAPAEREAFLASRSRPPRGPRQASAGELPPPCTPLIGRESELERVLDLTRRPDVRLLTISGPPGVGKSRLALEVARLSRGDRFDEAVFVSLAPLADPDLVGSAVALALALPAGSGPLVERLAERIGSRRVLLLLDDFERLVTAAPMLVELAARCPRLLLLVTSRMSLRVRGEQEYSLRPLRLPDDHEVASGVLDAVPSVALFLERARATSLEVTLTPRTRPVVAEICRTLDGLPLALELAAPWVKVFSLEALLVHLRERRLNMLVGGAQDLPQHQRTMRDTVRWSYDHLSGGERALFRRLSIFAGSPSLTAVEAVCQAAGGVDGDLLQLAAALVDKNLLQRDARASEPRFSMLRTIRAFGREMLQASGDAGATARAHANHYRALVEARTRRRPARGSRGG